MDFIKIEVYFASRNRFLRDSLTNSYNVKWIWSTEGREMWLCIVKEGVRFRDSSSDIKVSNTQNYAVLTIIYYDADVHIGVKIQIARHQRTV